MRLDDKTLAGKERQIAYKLFETKWRTNHAMGYADVSQMLKEFEELENKFRSK